MSNLSAGLFTANPPHCRTIVPNRSRLLLPSVERLSPIVHPPAHADPISTKNQLTFQTTDHDDHDYNLLLLALTRILCQLICRTLHGQTWLVHHVQVNHRCPDIFMPNHPQCRTIVPNRSSPRPAAPISSKNQLNFQTTDHDDHDYNLLPPTLTRILCQVICRTLHGQAGLVHHVQVNHRCPVVFVPQQLQCRTIVPNRSSPLPKPRRFRLKNQLTNQTTNHDDHDYNLFPLALTRILCQSICRTLHGQAGLVHHVQVNHRCPDVFVPQQLLHCTNVGTIF